MMQWDIDHWDEEDAESYKLFYEETEELDWDDDDW